jgi:hypothetical protein
VCYLQLVINKFIILYSQLSAWSIIPPFIQIHLILKSLRHTTPQSKFFSGGGSDDDDDYDDHDDIYNDNNNKNNNNLNACQDTIHNNDQFISHKREVGVS